MIIYCATNTKNNKKYIGQTVCGLTRRQRDHLAAAKRGDKGAFYNAIRKHGGESLEWAILYYAKSIEELNAMEEYYIAAYETRRPNGYNIMFGGGNRRMPESVRVKLRGRVISKETRAKQSASGKNKVLSAEHRASISASGKGKQAGEGHHQFGKRGASTNFFGKNHTAEARSKMRVAKIGRCNGYENNNFDPKVYAFLHAEHGMRGCTRATLIRDFSLSDAKISLLISGKRKSHKGWRMAGNL